MRNSYLAICLMVLPLLSSAQVDDVAYLDSYLESCNKRQATYVKKASGQSENGYEAKIETLSGRILATGTYRDKELSIEHGLFTYYHDNGKVESRGNYQFGKKSGEWERFDKNGNAKASKIYDAEVLSDIVHSQVDIEPIFQSSHPSVAEYLKETVSTDDERDNKGVVRAEFVVEKDGSIGDVALSNGLNDLMNERIIRALKEMPEWIPGKHNDQEVRVTRQVVVKF